MAKRIAPVFVCNDCTHRTSKWFGCCPHCGSWESMQEVAPQSAYSTNSPIQTSTSSIPLKNKPQTIAAIDGSIENKRMISGIDEWDKVIGGGIVPGSFMVLTGDPGVGKSTLLMQIAHALSLKNITVLYICTEESLPQVKMRAFRLNLHDGTVLFSDTPYLEQAVSLINEYKPQLLIIDSLQNCHCQDSKTIIGSISQLKELAFTFMRIAKENNISIIATGHITKDGGIAGPKTLEHMVDTVLYLQSDERLYMRMLRTVKNRFGSTSELGFFSMDKDGFHQMNNINTSFFEAFKPAVGSILASYDEGSRSIFVELQALIVPTRYNAPQRVITGIEYNRVLLIAAILEKHAHIKFGAHDMFFKVSSGVRLDSHCLDLAIALALLSSFFNQPLKPLLALGEINLSGEIRPVGAFDLHVQEAITFGITHIIASGDQITNRKGVNIERMRKVKDLLELFRN